MAGCGLEGRRHRLLRVRHWRVLPADGLAQIAVLGRITVTNRYVWCGNAQDGKSKNARRAAI
jgi:hypothetical protein